MRPRVTPLVAGFALIMMTAPLWAADAATAHAVGLEQALPLIEAELVARHGEEQRPRIRRGLRQVVGLWRAEDGDTEAFRAFATPTSPGTRPRSTPCSSAMST
jgi:hypothetical protein